MFKTCGLFVVAMGTNRGRTSAFPQTPTPTNLTLLENHSLIQTLHNFYTHSFTLQSGNFLSVIDRFYTVCTRLIITKTNNI